MPDEKTIPSPEARLTVISGPEQGRSFDLSPDCPLTLGRGQESDTQFNDAMVSRVHCRVVSREGMIFITDLGSSHGTRVNGKLYDEGCLFPGDIIKIGSTEIQVMQGASSPSFFNLIDGLKDGDEHAAEEIFQQFSAKLVVYARSRMNDRVRKKDGEEDIVQSVFKSFFNGFQKGQFALANWESLWGLLTRIALRKCGKRVRSLQAAVRDIRRETPLGAQGLQESPVRDPTPEETVMLGETLELLVSGLDTNARRVLELKLQGYSTAEIADSLGVSKRTVYRTLEEIKSRIHEMNAS